MTLNSNCNLNVKSRLKLNEYDWIMFHAYVNQRHE